MGAFFVYIVKSSVCLAVFYLFYRLLLSRETFHRFNRIALLGILVLSCVIPFVEVTVESTGVGQQWLTWEEMMLMADFGQAVMAEDAPVSAFGWREVSLMVYVLGIVFFCLRNLWSLGRMLKLIKGGRWTRQANGIRLITHQKAIAPFSWMQFVVISEKDLEENGREILAHEYAHIRKRHSVDLLIADICIFFQWFNPASWLLKQELQNIHEFEADESVIEQGIDAKRYQLLLIKKAVGTRLYSMANSFNHSSLKKRITMMLKKKSNPWARLKYLYVLPLAAVAVAAFARPEISTELNEISALKVNDLAAMVKTEEVKSFETVPVSGQEKKVKVKGNIRDKADNSPMVGVAVIVKGTTTGSVTDLDGNFALEIPEGSTLVCSYVGYGTKEFLVRPGVTEINGVMEKDNSDAAGQTKREVRVVGIGEQKGMDSTPVFQVVEEMPEFPGGMAECLKFLAQNIKYPVEAQQEGIQGKVIAQFVVEKDGSISNPIVLRSIDPRLDGEAIRVVSIMPKWKPGMQEGQLVRVKYTIPISFSLNKKEPSEVASMDMDIRFDGKRPLVVMDGQKVAWDTIQRLDPSKIESFHILGESRTKESYGEEGKDGVILITTKKEKKK
ncbi:M56 family metallopeptidase [Phocaeicola sp.]|uniref:M56 family metallopeptidase n=1 Tax=Phocaeicola sp. TaxID=2773926 RepID=UPI0023D72AD6|nr:M56 family metallopeptidase [Phocaeicola sp.]MDE5677118.1 TonB family protein [Phocaeicola sp.]